MKPIRISSTHAIEHTLLHRPNRIQSLSIVRSALSNPKVKRIESLAQNAGIKIHLSDQSGKDGAAVTAVIAAFPYTEIKPFIERHAKQTKQLVIALDHLQDPHNLGAIIRSAEALGANAVMIPKTRSALVSEGVYASSAGAVETLPIILVANLGEGLRKFKEQNYWIVGAHHSEKSTEIRELPTFDKIVLVMGAEDTGLTEIIQKVCDWHLMIPQVGKIESLNVSVASAILTYAILSRHQAT